MKARTILVVLAFLSLTSVALAQEPESKPAPKPASKPAPKPAPDKKAKVEKKELSLDRKVALELGSLKEVKAFLERMNKASGDVLGGKNATAAFGDMKVELEDSEQFARAWKDLRDAGAHKLIFTGLELRLYIGVPGGEGASLKSIALFSKGKVLFVPGKVSIYEENYKPRGCSADDLPKNLKFLSVLGEAMRTKAKECKRSKNFPFVKEEDFDLMRALFKRSMTKERFAEDLKKQGNSGMKMFLKLKSKDKVEIQYDIDDALYLVEDKEGKEIGCFFVDFDLNKNDVTIQFKSFRSTKN